MEQVRREMAHRPLLLAAVALCIGLTAVQHPANLLFLLPLLWPSRPTPVAVAFLLGLTLAPRQAPLLIWPLWLDGKAAVQSVPAESREGLAVDVLLNGHRWRAVFPRNTSMSRGEIWLVRGRAKPLSEVSDPLRMKGIEGKVKPVAFAKLADGPWPWRAADGWKRSYVLFAHRTLPEREARWLTGFAFRSADFDEEERDALVDTGTVHLIAASGLHVAALGGLVLAIGLMVGAPRAAVLAVAFGFVAAYAMATGLHMPTIRAALAFTVASSAYLFRREPDGLSALALAVLVYLPFDPAQVYGIGFQLSTAVVGMLVLWPRHHGGEPVRTAVGWFSYHLRDLVAVSLVAALAAEPILALHEGKIALFTIPANVVAVPLVMPAILLASILHPLGAGWAMPAVGGLVALARRTIEWAGGLTGTVWNVPPFSPYLLAVWFGVWIWFWRPRARPCD